MLLEILLLLVLCVGLPMLVAHCISYGGKSGYGDDLGNSYGGKDES